MTRGEIWLADFGIPFGSEPGFRRPVIVIQSDDFNKSRINTVIIIPLTTNLLLEEAPGNVFLDKSNTKLSKDSVAVVSQLCAIDKQRMVEMLARIDNSFIEKIVDGILMVFGIRKRNN